jgi:hypothetical protein
MEQRGTVDCVTSYANFVITDLIRVCGSISNIS